MEMEIPGLSTYIPIVSCRSQLKTDIDSSLPNIVSKCSIGFLYMDRFFLGLKGANDMIY
jgi:hypothetical protein